MARLVYRTLVMAGTRVAYVYGEKDIARAHIHFETEKRMRTPLERLGRGSTG